MRVIFIGSAAFAAACGGALIPAAPNEPAASCLRKVLRLVAMVCTLSFLL
jgi:hypothetical protein